VVTAPPPARKPAPQPDTDEEASWESLADTDSPGGRADTAPRSASARKRRESKEITPSQRKTVLLVVGVVVGVLALLAVALAVAAHLGLFGKSGTPGTANNQPAGAVLYVNKNAPSSAFKSLTAALARVKPGDRIVIQDDVIEDTLPAFDGKVHKGFSVEGEEGKTVVWRLPKNRQAPTLLLLTGVEGLKLSNLTFDGDGRVEQVLVLTGRCPGLTLENVQLRGFTKYGVRVSSCEGTTEQPVVLKGLRTVAAAEAEAAAFFEVGQGMLIKENRNIQLVDCRFEGPYKQILLGQGPAVAGVELKGTNAHVPPAGQPALPVVLTK
jgi:hypothetical protein